MEKKKECDSKNKSKNNTKKDSLEKKILKKKQTKEGSKGTQEASASVDKLDILILMQQTIRKMHEKELAEKRAKGDIGKKTKVKKKDDDLSGVVDEESDKAKDKDWDKVLQISVKMDGFEKFHLEQYAKQLETYQRMLSEYLRSSPYSAVNAYSYLMGEEGDVDINQDEMIGFDELWDALEQIHWNSVAGTENNYIHPDMKESLNLWSLFSYNRMKMQLWKITGDGGATFCGLNMY